MKQGRTCQHEARRTGPLESLAPCLKGEETGNSVAVHHKGTGQIRGYCATAEERDKEGLWALTWEGF